MNTDLREDVNRKQAAGSGRWALRKKDRGFETAKYAKYAKEDGSLVNRKERRDRSAAKPQPKGI